MLNTFEQIKHKVKSDALKKRVILWGADEPGWIEVLAKYQKEGCVQATLIGDEAKIKKAASAIQVDLNEFNIVKADSIADSIDAIKSELADNELDILIRGTFGIEDSLRALFAKDVGFRKSKSIVSAVSCHYVENIGRMLIVTDPVVIPVLDLTKKIALVNNAAAFARHLEDAMPKVAMLTAVETVYPVMQHTIEAAAIAKMNDRGQIKGCLVDGPLSMDCAVIESAAKSKGVKGEVGGHANVLVAPTIETAYGMYKAFSRFVGTPTGIVVIGGTIPVCMASRSDSNQTKENSLLLALL